MSTSIAVDANNDIYLDANGNLAMVTGLDAVAQDCLNAMKAQLGEMPLALTRGVPTDATIWSRYLPAQFEAASRALLLTVPGVVSVKAFDVTRAGNVASYVATIQTIYSDDLLTISGDLVQ